jgi:hypothetical protein
MFSKKLFQKIVCPACLANIMSKCETNHNNFFEEICSICKTRTQFIKCPQYARCKNIIPLADTFCHWCLQEQKKQMDEIEKQKKAETLHSSWVDKFKDIENQSVSLLSLDNREQGIMINDEPLIKFGPNYYYSNTDHKYFHSLIMLSHDQTNRIRLLESKLDILELILSKQNAIEDKLDKFLDMIEFAPGGPEFSKAEENFDQNIKKI